MVGPATIRDVVHVSLARHHLGLHLSTHARTVQVAVSLVLLGRLSNLISCAAKSTLLLFWRETTGWYQGLVAGPGSWLGG